MSDDVNAQDAGSEQPVTPCEQNVSERKPLNPKKKQFVEHYLKLGNGTKAAIAAGYSEATARQAASRLLTEPAVVAEIERRRAELTKKIEKQTGVTLERLVTELAAIALLDPADFYGPDGKVLALPDMPEHVRRALASVDVEEKVSGDDVAAAAEGAPIPVTRVSKFKPADKIRAIELAAKLQGYLKDTSKVDHNVTGTVTYRWKRDDE